VSYDCTHKIADGLTFYSSQELEVVKEQNASLQIQVLHLQEEINETQGKIRKVRDVSDTCRKKREVILTP
jgi:predicted transport protein